MASKIQLNIAEPCHESWASMTPSDKGKFCGSCQKQVIDFSMMSDTEIAQFFKRPATGSVCGRFMADQLERPIEIPKKRIPWLRYFFQIAIPAFLFTFKASAQGRKIGKVSVKDTKEQCLPGDTIKVNKPSGRTMGMVAPIDRPVKNIKMTMISGSVLDESGKPFPFPVPIRIAGSTDGTQTDTDGKFKMKIKSDQESIEITASVLGYMNETRIIKKKDYSTAIEFRIADPMIMGLMAVTVDDVPMKTIPATTEEVLKEVKVFPNPVNAGMELTIELKKAEQGYYMLELLNQSAQRVHQREVWIDTDARLLSFDVPKIAAGTYIVNITSKKSGKKYSDKVIVR